MHPQHISEAQAKISQLDFYPGSGTIGGLFKLPCPKHIHIMVPNSNHKPPSCCDSEHTQAKIPLHLILIKEKANNCCLNSLKKELSASNVPPFKSCIMPTTLTCRNILKLYISAYLQGKTVNLS